MPRVYLLGIYISFCFQWVVAQKYLPVERYDLTDGLPHSSITALHTDRDGLLWIGTKDGLSNYDGYSFHNYQSNVYDTNSLPNDRILNILEDKNGHLWCITPVGLSRYLHSTGGFHSIYVDSLNITRGVPFEIIDVSPDNSNAKIYILSRNFISVFDMESNRILTPATINDKLHGYLSDINSVLFLEESNKLVFGSPDRIFEFDLNADSLSVFTPPGNDEKGTLQVCAGNDSKYFVYTQSKVWEVQKPNELKQIKLPVINNRDLNRIVSLEVQNDSIFKIVSRSFIIQYDYINAASISAIEFDIPSDDRSAINIVRDMDCGLFWIGTEKGLFKFNKHNHAFRNILTSELTGSEHMLTAMQFDSNNRLWLGFDSGELILLTETEERAVIARMKFDSGIRIIYMGLKGDLWICTYEGLYRINEANPNSRSKIISGNFTAILQISPDSLLLTDQMNAYWYTPSTGLSVEMPMLQEYLGTKVLEIRRYKNLIYFLQHNRVIEYNLLTLNLQVLSTINMSSHALPKNTSIYLFGRNKAYIGTSDGIMEFSVGRANVKPLAWNPAINNQHIHAFVPDKLGNSWFSTGNGIFSTDTTEAKIRKYGISDGLLIANFSDRLAVSSKSGVICFGGSDGLVIFSPASLPVHNCIPGVKITEVRLSGKRGTLTVDVSDSDTLYIDSKYSHLRFSFASFDYWNSKQNRLAYSFSRPGKPDAWVSLEYRNTLSLSGLNAGTYILKVDGTNHEGLWNSEPQVLVLLVHAPVWQSKWAISSYIIFLAGFFYISIYLRTKHLRKLNREYRNRELISRKIEQQKEELSIKNKNITDSINYAKRIQMALMPSQRLFSRLFHDSFILHIPKDIVSGDFYWINQVDDRIYFAAVDCTGHGVPGAFMSIIGFDLFRRITEIEKKKQPAEVLNSLSRGFENIFRDVESITLRDGMDVAFCAMDKEMKVLEFAGAFNPLYLVRDNTITEIKGDRCSVGLNHEENVLENKFSNNVIQLREGDIIYIFTDGFADQFGGPEGKKYKYRRFRHLLLALHQLPMNRQVEFLRRSIMDWKGELDQVDDILVMGIRITDPAK
jgi:ligand-binding sensor domain-containing protein/serine phosphatase RsbU (regulator of sigma subunit)